MHAHPWDFDCHLAISCTGFAGQAADPANDYFTALIFQITIIA